MKPLNTRAASATTRFTFRIRTQAPTKELPLRYTVKRNTLFDVVISSISGPGANDPGGVVPDPTKPVETVVSMEVNITIAPWTIANLSAGI